MTKPKVLIRRVISPDGSTIAEAKSIVASSDENQNTISQITVRISSNSNCSSSSSAFSSSASDKK